MALRSTLFAIVMKKSALDYIVCPTTLDGLNLEIFEADGEEVMEGLLVTSDGAHAYPVINGVPRMLLPELREHLESDYPEYFAKHRNSLQKRGIITSDVGKVQRHTQEAFGYEWTWAADYDANNFDDWLPEGFNAKDLFSDKVGLEVGCGAGRHAERNSNFSKTHIAVDLSIAVDSAFERNRGKSNCHVVQADAFHLPFRPNLFDYVYCLGVIQHMHNPPEGFKGLADKVRKGGILLVNVYQAGRPLTVGALALVRKISIRLSNSQLRVISELAGMFEYGIFIFPWKVLKNTFLGKLLRPIVPTRIDEYAKHSMRTAVVDWFDRLSCPVKIHYTKEQLAGWYTSNGFKEVLVTPYWKAFWNGYGVKS